MPHSCRPLSPRSMSTAVTKSHWPWGPPKVQLDAAAGVRTRPRGITSAALAAPSQPAKISTPRAVQT